MAGAFCSIGEKEHSDGVFRVYLKITHDEMDNILVFDDWSKRYWMAK